MKLLIRKARIINALQTNDEGELDLLIVDGKISQVAKEIFEQTDEVIEASGMYLLPGLTDIAVQGGEPGFEHKETVLSLLNSAASGGFTKVFTLPNLQPVTHSVSEVEYLRKRSSGHLCNLLPVGALSQECKGLDISEMLDLKEAGVSIFSDGKHPVQHGGLLLRALLYVKSFNGLVMNQPLDNSVFPKGHLHEGLISTQIGVRGIPDIAESIMLQRDLELLEYTQSRLHVLSVSTKKSVELIRKAKAQGLSVSASVPVWNLIYTDKELLNFDNMFKLNPPLRSEEDRLALISGLKDGTIDCIISGHTPLDIEQKDLEFPYASPGAISLQSAFALTYEKLKDDFSMEELVRLWSYNPSMITDQNPPVIEPGSEVNLMLFDPNSSWSLNKKSNLSKSQNSPLWAKEINGQVKLAANKEKIMYF